ncbi:MAG TPA: 2Fe-2S iron-sulfur cluster binding domain-containing protein, partial [Alphaproteobacteria bacterium]|nr:2Fe-2S iron-sulfur cluster binding domain-containing protein [Alphaproteobacteria bacterium]
MTHKVHFRTFDIELEVADGQTILDAALAAKIDYPCGCQSGNCGACKSRLFTGKVDLAPYSEFALETSERDQ